MKAVKIIISAVVVAFSWVLSAQAVYLLGMDEISQDFSLNVFDTVSGSVIQSYVGDIPEETENVVYAGGNVAYGIQSDSSDSYLYEFVLSDNGTVISSEIGATGVGSVDAIALAGDTLYAVSTKSDSLYSVDTSSGVMTEVAELEYTYVKNNGKLKTTTLKNVQSLTYADGLLYGVDADSDELFSLDLDSSTVTVIGETANGIEGLSFGDDGELYAGAGDTLYTIDVSTGAATYSVDLSSWATDIEGLSSFSYSSGVVPEPGSVLAWLLVAGGAGVSVRRKHAFA